MLHKAGLLRTYTTLVLFLTFLFVIEAQYGRIKHFVSFRFKPQVSTNQRLDVMNRFAALKKLCVRPTTGEPYILDLNFGRNNSKEGVDQNMTQGYIVTFENSQDRDYYVGKPFQQQYDPHHDAFKQFVGPLLDGVFVFDFEDQSSTDIKQL